MEEKQAIKISLSSFFLLIAIIVICIMGVFIYKINNDKIAEKNKTEELQKQIYALNEINRKNPSETIYNKNNNDTIKGNNTVINNDENGKYYGKWVDEDNSSELEILVIGNKQLAFSWAVYRVASIDNTVIPIENNKAEFYFQGYEDKNYNSKQDEEEHFYRKATIELKDNSINIKVENIESSKYDITKERDFYGIDEGTFTYKIK